MKHSEETQMWKDALKKRDIAIGTLAAWIMAVAGWCVNHL